MPLNEKTDKCKGFTFAIVLEHEKEILKWYNIRKNNYCN